ncbi:MAG: sugar phosphate isomerase/epimerase [Planctomycetaceae bacterium]|nr:sugar phosphate isomerase/epimerase [Planctomycetaceae bacterium]
MKISRRLFAATTFAGVSAFQRTAFGALSLRQSANPVCVFTKPLQSLPWEDLAQRMAALGVAGIEAPVRAGGHIEPVDAVQRLPEFVGALKKFGQHITVMTSDINDANDPLTEPILRTAAGLGIRFYRMKYFKYDESKPILSQISNWTAALKDLAAINKQLGITAVYQNHAGRNYFGAALWDLHRALEQIDPAGIGVAYDIRHATAEAGMSWPVTFRLLQPHVRVVYVKDFVWSGQKPDNVPLGQGSVSPSFFQMLADSQFDGPISLHEEYLDHRRPELVPEHLAAIERDLNTLRKWMTGAGGTKKQ